MAHQTVRSAFKDEPNLAARVGHALDGLPPDSELVQLLVDISSYILLLRSPNGRTSQDDNAQEPNSKKRKLDHNTVQATSSDSIADASTVFEFKDVSFSIPARKKLKLELTSSTSKPSVGQIRLIDPKTDALEYSLDARNIDKIFCLPVPEKTQRQQTFVIFPNEEEQPGTTLEQIVFTVNETPDKTGALGTRSTDVLDGETYVDVTTRELNSFLSRQRKQVVVPDAKEFASSIPQAHRKGEKAYHVKAFRGSKEGYLFFLPIGILFGFKKPLAFFPFARIESISYTSVLQRTFNLVITALPMSADEPAQEVEFSMLDQADFAGIDEYIKAHGLNDASMAAERRAKAYNVNKEPKASGEENGVQDVAGAENGQSELEKAEQQLQDEEDELEEDYDPSGGESEGEGEGSEEEEEGYEYEDGDEEEEGEGELDDEGEEEPN